MKAFVQHQPAAIFAPKAEVQDDCHVNRLAEANAGE